jgi:ribosomal protein S27AE
MTGNKPNPPLRFEDTGEVLYNLSDEILVVCPRCNSCARITLLAFPRKDWRAPRRLSCIHCGYNRDSAKPVNLPGIRSGPPVDDYFGESLWLQIPFGREVLWAYNQRHLALMTAYIRASLREHERNPQFGWRNSSLLNRLPRWMTSKKNRAEILKLLEKLRRLAENQ